MRINNEEIESAIEMFVNSIYDNGSDSDWVHASLEDWQKAVYEELVTWKTDNQGAYWPSPTNRFEGKERLMKRIVPLLKSRLSELKAEGYDIKAI